MNSPDDDETKEWTEYDNAFQKRCSGREYTTHEPVDIDLKYKAKSRCREGQCPMCKKVYVTRIRGRGW